MKEIKYSIKTLDPIIVSSESGNQFSVPTKDYIPGGMILGAFAGVYLDSQKNADALFSDLFVKGRVNYNNAYKLINETTTYPLPLSIHQEKNNESKVYDLLYSDLDVQTRALGGYGYLEGGKLRRAVIKKSSNSHHERDYDKGAPKSGVFFNYESINKGQFFEGSIWGDDELLNKFNELFKETEFIRIGRSKGTEYGKIKINLYGPTTKESKEIVINNDSTVSLTFLSDAIIFNSFGISTSDYKTLEELLKEKISPDIKIKKSFMRTTEIESFVSVWKLKRPSEISFKAGSCLLLQIPDLNSEGLIKKLKTLQKNGFGERIHEGFGQIQFGLQPSTEKVEILELPKDPVLKPNTPPPILVQISTQKLATDYLNKVAAVEALNLVRKNSTGFEKKISSSQIGRLEGFVKISSTNQDFKNQIEPLRKTSKDKLSSCRIENTNLLLFIKDTSITELPAIKSNISKIKSMLEDIYQDAGLLESITKNLFKVFYMNMFAAMRKAIKGGKKS